MKRLFSRLTIAALAMLFQFATPGGPSAAEWKIGDIFVANNSGRYTIFDRRGNAKDTLDTGIFAFNAGCAFNTLRNELYTTRFNGGDLTGLRVHDANDPHALVAEIFTGQQGSKKSLSAESVVFRADGSYTVGHADGDKALHFYDSDDVFVKAFLPRIKDDGQTTGFRGTNWHDTAVDQTTVFYTSESRKVRRFNLTTGEQLPDFATIPGDRIPAGPYVALGLRLLPPGDGSGGVLVADEADIKRLDASGAVAHTYSHPDIPGGWFVLSLDPDGTSFWAGSFNPNAVDPVSLVKFDIATGAPLIGPNPVVGEFFLNGLCILGELLAATNLPFDFAVKKAVLALEVKKKHKPRCDDDYRHEKPHPDKKAKDEDDPQYKAYGKSSNDGRHEDPKSQKAKAGDNARYADPKSQKAKASDSARHDGRHEDKASHHYDDRTKHSDKYCDDEASHHKGDYGRYKAYDRDPRDDDWKAMWRHELATVKGDHVRNKPLPHDPEVEQQRSVLLFRGTMNFGAPFNPPQDVIIDIDSSTEPANAINPVTIPAAAFVDDGAGNYVATVEVIEQQPLGVPLSVEVVIPKSGAGEFRITVRNLAADLSAPPVEVTIYVRIGTKTGRAVVDLNELIPNRVLVYFPGFNGQPAPAAYWQHKEVGRPLGHN